MADQALHQHLRELQADGQHHSAGQFTIAVDALRRKMSEAGADQPGSFILRGVQAAVAMRALEVKLRITRAGVEIEFYPTAAVGLTADGLLQDEALRSRPGVQHLRAMWLQAMAAGRVRFSWQQDQTCFVWTTERGIEPSTHQQSPARCHLIVTLPSRPLWQFAAQGRVRGELQASVVQRGAFCPIPIKLDGRIINDPRPEAMAEMGLSTAGTPILPSLPNVKWAMETITLTPSAHDGGFALAGYPRRPAARVITPSDRFPRQEFFLGKHVSAYSWILNAPDRDEADTMPSQRDFLALGEVKAPKRTIKLTTEGYLDYQLVDIDEACPPLRVSRWVGLSNGLKRDRLLFYVKDGILLNAVRPRNIGSSVTSRVRAIVWSNSVTTDLGGFDVVRDDMVQADLDSLVEEEKLVKTRVEALVDTRNDRLLYHMDPQRIWDKPFRLHPQFILTGRTFLPPPGVLFGEGHLYSEEVTLLLALKGRTIEIQGGPAGLPPSLKLCSFSELTRISLERRSFSVAREKPQHLPAPAIQVRLTLFRREQKLIFIDEGLLEAARPSADGIASFPSMPVAACARHQEALLEWAKRLAQAAGVTLNYSEPENRLW